MRSLLPLLACLALLIPARALELKIDSVDTDNTIWVTAKPVDRQLQYKEKDQKLVAVVTYRDDLHSSTAGQSQEDTLFFRFPGVKFDPSDETLSVETPDKAVIPIGEWRKSGLGNRHVLLYVNTEILVSNLRGHVQLTLDIDTDRTPESIDKARKAETKKDDDAQTYTLDSLMHGKGGGN